MTARYSHPSPVRRQVMSPTMRVQGLSRGEVPADQVRPGHRLLAGYGRGLIGPGLAGPQPGFAHQVRGQAHAARISLPVELGSHPPAELVDATGA